MVFKDMKKWTLPTIIVLAALFVLFVAYIDDNPSALDSGETKTFNVSSGSSELSKAIDTIKTSKYYKGYDAETVKWMESLGNKRIFFGKNAIVIMDISDARKIPQDPPITDVYVYNIFTANVVESHDLGYKYPTVYNVQNVKFVDQEIVGNGLA